MCKPVLTPALTPASTPTIVQTPASSQHTSFHFGNQLKTFRKSKKMSLDYVSRLSGISKSHLWSMEKGVSEPRLSTLTTLASVYNLTPAAFLSILSSLDSGSQSTTSQELISIIKDLSPSDQEKLLKLLKILF